MKHILWRITQALMLSMLVIILYLLLWPVEIDPMGFTPPAAPPAVGVYAPNDRLAKIEKLAKGYFAPESVAIGSDGYLYTGVQDGKILRVSLDGTTIQVFAAASHPLGMEFDAKGNLIVAAASLGLISVDRAGKITVLTNKVDGTPINFADDLAIASNGVIYFSDASTKFGLSNYLADFFEYRPNGRLLVYEPATGKTRVLLNKLYFANGVALSPDESYLLFNETWKYRVSRYWLTGPQAGQVDIFIDNLPGTPDNITSNGKDTYWVALAAGPEARATIDPLLSQPFMRKVMWRLPKFLLPSPKAPGYILGLDLKGNVVDNLQDPTGDVYPQTTSAIEYNGMLYLGSIGTDGIGRIPIR